MGKKRSVFRSFTARLAFTLALAAIGVLVLASPVLATAGYLVSDAKKECYFLPQNPGIGLGGLRWADECPEGYEVKPLPQPETPWYFKLLELLDRWFGLKNRVLWLPSAGQVAFVTSLVLLLRRLLQVFQLPFIQTLTKGWGTVILSTIISFLTVVEPLIADQQFTWYELILALVSTVGAAAATWEVLKSLVGPSSGSERIVALLRKLFK